MSSKNKKKLSKSPDKNTPKVEPKVKIEATKKRVCFSCPSIYSQANTVAKNHTKATINANKALRKSTLNCRPKPINQSKENSNIPSARTVKNCSTARISVPRVSKLVALRLTTSPLRAAHA